MTRLVLVVQALLAAAATALLAPVPAAADSMPLSALPEKPVRYTKVRGPVPVPLTPDSDRYTITSEPPVCLSFTAPKYWIDGDPLADTHQTFMWVDPGTTFVIERLIDRGETAELERIAAVIRYRSIDPTARSRITLHPVAKLDGLTVYAYRWAAKVLIVARSSMSDPIFGPTCGIAFAQLVVSDGQSRAAQIVGTVPRTGKRYIVNADISQTSRDPEPLLTVTARVLDR